MLAVQKYLQTQSFDDLENELGIKTIRHESLPLIILNYSIIDSPKIHPVVRECRGLVLHTDTHEVVAKSFNRFFNWGEVVEEMGHFDFTDFSVQSKEDGSLVLLYHFNGKWCANTRGSFAQDNMPHQDFTWQQGITRAMFGFDIINRIGNPDWTYVCEFCSPWNKVVRRYEEPALYLLSAFNKKTLEEMAPAQCDDFVDSAGFILRPIVYDFKSIEEIQVFLREQAENDPTYEGVVIRDKHNHRWKIKSSTYLGLHRMRRNNNFNPKNLLPFIMTGEEDELLTYFPEVKEAFYKLKCEVLSAYVNLLEVWADNKDIEDQKEFALAVKHTPFSSMLFNVRKKHKEQKALHVAQEWRDSEQQILKRLCPSSGHPPCGKEVRRL